MLRAPCKLWDIGMMDPWSSLVALGVRGQSFIKLRFAQRIYFVSDFIIIIPSVNSY